MSNQHQEGKEWVVKHVETLADGTSVLVADIEWRRSSTDFDHNRETLAFTVNGKPRSVKFEQRDLEDWASPAVQIRLDQQLRQIVYEH